MGASVLTRTAYKDLLAIARRHARGRMEAEDLLQQAMLAALAAGRGRGWDDRAWLGGVMRNIALMNARGTIRRRRREERFAEIPAPSPEDDAMPDLGGLAPSLRIVALLALTGHGRGEIRHLLRISDEALRQRIAGLRRHWKAGSGRMPSGLPALRGGLAFGTMRRSLLPLVRGGSADFASHDPDGHPIAFKIRRA